MRRGATPSVVRRITVRLSLITLAAIALSYAWLLYQVRYAADRLAESSLIEEANKIAGELHLGPDGPIFKLPREMRGDPALADGNFRYSVSDTRHNILFRSPWPPSPFDQVRIADPKYSLYETSHQLPQSLDFFGAVVKRDVAGTEYTILAEKNMRQLETIMDTFLGEFFYHGAWVYVVLLLGLLVVSVLTIKRAISPVERLSMQAATIGPQSTDLRLSEAGVPREILGFIRAVNSALDRLDVGFQVQREFTADAAHELRTPLAVLRAHIDTLDDRVVADELRRDVDSMAHIVAQLLRSARLDAMVVDPRESCDLSDTAVSVAALLIPAALDKKKRIEVRGAERPVWVAGNPDLAFHALRNIVENAIIHSGPGCVIDIAVAEDCTVRVIDRGPGIPAHLRERVFRRFWRSERSGEGAGLGLPIVRRSMELCGGAVAIADTPGGGATFVLVFQPAVPPEAGVPAAAATADALTAPRPSG